MLGSLKLSLVCLAAVIVGAFAANEAYQTDYSCQPKCEYGQYCGSWKKCCDWKKPCETKIYSKKRQESYPVWGKCYPKDYRKDNYYPGGDCKDGCGKCFVKKEDYDRYECDYYDHEDREDRDKDEDYKKKCGWAKKCKTSIYSKRQGKWYDNVKGECYPYGYRKDNYYAAGKCYGDCGKCYVKKEEYDRHGCDYKDHGYDKDGNKQDYGDDNKDKDDEYKKKCGWAKRCDTWIENTKNGKWYKVSGKCYQYGYRKANYYTAGDCDHGCGKCYVKKEDYDRHGCDYYDHGYGRKDKGKGKGKEVDDVEDEELDNEDVEGEEDEDRNNLRA